MAQQTQITALLAFPGQVRSFSAKEEAPTVDQLCFIIANQVLLSSSMLLKVLLASNVENQTLLNNDVSSKVLLDSEIENKNLLEGDVERSVCD